MGPCAIRVLCGFMKVLRVYKMGAYRNFSERLGDLILEGGLRGFYLRGGGLIHGTLQYSITNIFGRRLGYFSWGGYT